MNRFRAAILVRNDPRRNGVARASGCAAMARWAIHPGMKRLAILTLLVAPALSACVELAPALPELREDYMGKSLLEPKWEPQVQHDELGEPELD